jgi:hypothetical protein
VRHLAAVHGLPLGGIVSHLIRCANCLVIHLYLRISFVHLTLIKVVRLCLERVHLTEIVAVVLHVVVSVAIEDPVAFVRVFIGLLFVELS